MEEVWKDISLASLHENPTRTDPVSFQDFFSPQKAPKNPFPAAGGASCRCPSPSPPTVLRLNSGGTDEDIIGIFGSDPIITNPVLRPEPHWNVPDINVGFDGFATGSGLPVLGNKRLPGPDGNSGDRRYKRMVKNRESAARSRARRQAYIYELELKVAHLLKENAKLKKQEELLSAAAAEAPEKKSLRRTSSASF